MMWSFLTKKKVLAPIISGVLTLSFLLVPVSQTLEIKRADAIYYDPYNTIVNTISSLADTASEVYGWALKNKELVLDGIAWQVANLAIKEMIKSLTKWVNSGFDGNPTFVTNLEGFMTDVADKAAGNFIWGNKELKFLCSPFALDIKLALDLQYREARDFETQCTLSDVVDNMDSFFAGDFLAGGWDGWYEMTQSPKNNPYGALLEAQSALTVKIGEKQLYEGTLLDFGKGFFSMKDPRCKPDPANPDDFDESRCTLVTPGTAIESQLNTSLAGGLRRLEVADELNELVGALLSQLASNIFSSAGGLLGSTESGSGSGGGSYFDDVLGESDPTDPDFGATSFDDVLSREREYLDLITEAVDMVASAQTYWKDTYSFDDEDPRTSSEERCYESGALPAPLAQTLTETQFEQSTTNLVIAGIEGLRADFSVLSDPESPENVITSLLAKYNADSIPATKAKIMSQLSSYLSSGMLHNSGNIGRFQAETLPRIEREVTAFMESVDRACGGGDGGGD